jgi:hypothetical protein
MSLLDDVPHERSTMFGLMRARMAIRVLAWVVRRCHATVPLLCVCALLGATHAKAAGAGFTDGLWLTEGYGQAFSIEGDQLRRYEVTSASCMADISATRQAGAGDTERFVGTTVNPDTGAKDAFILARGGDADHVTLHVEGAIANFGLVRIKALPQACSVRPVNDPPHNFEIFAKTFAEQYAFFKLRRMNWAAVVARHGAQIDERTSGADLFTHFRAMIAPLQDAHTEIDAPNLIPKRSYDGWRPPAAISDDARRRAHAIIEQRYLMTPLTWYCNDRIGFGMLPDDVGYIRIRSFENYASDAGFDQQIEALNAALDSIFGQARNLQGLVIDVRLNDGGADEFGTIVAGRLTRHRYLAYSKVYRIDPERPDRLSRPQRILVKPTRRPGFYGPVALLIGHESVSAAETFAMALQGRHGDTVFVGENTQGVFSDVLTRHLPNGWTFGVPNEIYLTADGNAYDLVGVPPDDRVPVFAHGDLERGRDPALEAAMRDVQDGNCDARRKSAARPQAAGN